MQRHVIILNTTGPTYAFYEIDKRKETRKNEKQLIQIKRKKKRKNRRNKLSCPPRRRCGIHFNRRARKKKKKKKTPQLVNRFRVILWGHSYRSFFSNFSTFFSRNFSVFHVFLFFSSKYWNVNKLDIFASGEFHE